MGWYNYNPKDVVRVYEDKDFIVDYNKSGKMYRVSVFDDDHFKDEFWFDAYGEKECLIRCKDCRHYVSYGYINNPEDLLYRCKFGIFNNQRDNKDSDFFCCYGEPRINVMF